MRAPRVLGLVCAAALAGCGTALPGIRPAARTVAREPDRVAVLADGGRLSVLDVRTGRIFERLGRIRDEVDQGFGYSASDQEIFVLQLQRRHEELVAVSARTGRRSNVVPATAFALSPTGAQIAYVTSNGRDIALRDLATGRTRTWSPDRALPRDDYVRALAFSSPTTVAVATTPEPVATDATDRSARRPTALPRWFEVTERGGTLTGRSLEPPSIPDPQPLLSYDAAAPGSVFAVSRARTTEVFRVTASGNSFGARLVLSTGVSLALALSPRGGQLVFVPLLVRHGNQYTNLDVCALRPRCTPRVLERNAQLGEVSWETG